MTTITRYRSPIRARIPFGSFNRDIWLICLSNVIGAFGEGLYFWVFPNYVRSLQADYVQLGTVTSILFGVAALAPIPGGLLADRFDRKKILILSWTPWIFAPLIFSLAENWTQLIPGTVCWGVSMIGFPAITAYAITSVNDERKYTTALALVWSSYSLSYVFAPAVGGYLATVFGMRTVLQMATVLAAISTCIFFFLRSQNPKQGAGNTAQQSISPSVEKKLWSKMLFWAAFFAAATFFISVARPYVPTFLKEEIGFNEFYVGLFGSFNFAGLTLIGMVMGHLGDRWRKSGPMGLVLLLYTFSMIPLLVTRDTSALMFIAFMAGAVNVSSSLVSSFVGTIAPQHKRGLWISIPQTVSLFASTAAPYLGGFLCSYSPYYAFIVSICGTPLLALFALFKMRE